MASLLGGGGAGRPAVLHPQRLRWPTPAGPFRVGEMCLEDIALVKLGFTSMSMLPCMMAGMDTAQARARADAHMAASKGWWVVSATFEA